MQQKKRIFTGERFPDRVGKIVAAEKRRDEGVRLIYVIVDKLGRQIIDPLFNLPFTARVEDFERYMQAGRLRWA